MKKMLKKISKLGLALALVLGGLMSYKSTNVEAKTVYLEQPVLNYTVNYDTNFEWTVGKKISDETDAHKTIIVMFFTSESSGGLELEKDHNGEDVTGWFKGSLPKGVHANLIKISKDDCATRRAFPIVFSGTPTEVTPEKNIELEIPAGWVTHWIGGTEVNTIFSTDTESIQSTTKVNDTALGSEATTFITNHLTVNGVVITEVTLENYQQVLDASADYEALSEEVKAEVKNKLSKDKDYPDLLTAANTIKAAVEAANAWKEKHRDILAIDVSAITKDHLTAITNALTDYDKLTPATAKDVLTTEKNKLDSMKAAAEADQKAIDDAKAKAKKDIEKDATDKIAEINALEELTANEKKTYIDVINTAKETALKGIDASDTEVEIDSVKATFTSATNENYKKARVLNAKKAAKRKYSEKAKEIIDNIKTLDLADNEKKEFIDEIESSIPVANASFEAGKDYRSIFSDYKDRIKTLGGIGDKAVALAFTNSYLREKAGAAIYGEATSDNVDQILSGAKDYETLSDEQKALVNEMIAEATEYDTYEDYVEAVGTFVTDSAIKFIENHLTKDDEVIQSATPKTYEMILGGEEDWNKLSENEKKVINESLKKLGATQSYDVMLAAAKATFNKTATDFVKKYVSDEKGNVFKTVTKDNYAQILSGKDAWDKLSQTEKDAVNKMLTENGSMTFEELLQLAQKAKADAEGSKTASTGDTSNMALWMSMLTLSAGAVLLSEKKRRNI